MTARSRIALVVLPALVLIVFPGCSRFAKEGIGYARGARGLYVPLKAVASETQSEMLAQYQRFELARLTDDFGGRTPGELWNHLETEFYKQLAEKCLPNAQSGKTLLIRGEILHYEGSGIIEQISPLEEVIARIELVDKDSGQVIETANCIGRTKESCNIGVAKKGEGLARAIVSWLDDRYPKAGRPEPIE